MTIELKDLIIKANKDLGNDWDGDLVYYNGETYYVDESQNQVEEV